jgi:hypothetical protein
VDSSDQPHSYECCWDRDEERCRPAAARRALDAEMPARLTIGDRSPIRL